MKVTKLLLAVLYFQTVNMLLAIIIKYLKAKVKQFIDLLM